MASEIATRGMIEPLEGRRLLASAAIDSSGHLQVLGDTAFKNLINVTESPDGLNVRVTIVSTGGANVDQTFPVADITLIAPRVHIVGGAWQDTINVGQDGVPFTLRTRVEGRQRADTIRTAGEKDVIYGNNGNDLIYAGAGNDTVRAGNGDDSIYGENGNDVLWGAAGADKIYGGNGNDLLGGYLGINQLYGGKGADRFWVRDDFATTFQTNDFNGSQSDWMDIRGANDPSDS